MIFFSILVTIVVVATFALSYFISRGVVKVFGIKNTQKQTVFTMILTMIVSAVLLSLIKFN